MNVIEHDWEWAGPLTDRKNTEYVILHHSAASGTAEALHGFHRSRGWAGIGYHFYVRADGSVHRGRPVNAVGAHTVGYNAVSAGVCFEGDLEKTQMPQAQLAAGLELLAELKKLWPRAKLGLHRELDATACPGKNFPEKEFRAAWDTRTAPADVPAAWAAEACRWAGEKGLFTGDGTAMNWQAPVDRQTLAVVLRRLEAGRGA